MLQMIVALLVLAGVWGFAEFLSIKTKALLSLVFVALSVLLIGSWTGTIPTDLVEKAGLTGLATIAIPLVLVHMGTTISTKQLKSEWKTVVITMGALVTLLLGMLTFGALVLGKEIAISGIPIIFGGGVAGLVLTPVLQVLGLDYVIGYVWIMVAIQIFVGIPVASFFLKKFARKLINTDAMSELAVASSVEIGSEQEIKTCLIPAKYQTTFILIFITTALGALGLYLGEYTNTYVFIHQYVVCLIFGFLAVKFRILPESVMAKANAYGILVFAMFLYIGNIVVASISFQAFIQLLKPVVLSFVIGVPSLAVGAVITSKLIKMDSNLSIALACACMIGFPTTILMSEEISVAIGRTEEEVATLKTYLVPKMLIAGLVTVSIVSGILASVLANFL